MMSFNVEAIIENTVFCNPENESMMDIRIDQSFPNSNYDNDNMGVANSSKNFGASMHSISMFPFGTVISEAYIIANAISIASVSNISIHLIKPINGINGTFDESVTTFNTENPCSYPIAMPYGSFYISSSCNESSEDVTNFDVIEGTGNRTFNVTNALQIAVNEWNETNISFAYLASFISGDTAVTFATKDQVDTVTRQPICLNVTYGTPDITEPKINISLNITALFQGYIVNVTGNSSDETELSFCNILTNQTGENVYYNFSLSGLSGYCGQNITIASGISSVINFTVRINDTSNNTNQASQQVSIADTTNPILYSINFSKFSIIDGNRLNVTINISDADSNLFKIIYNLTNPNGVTTQRTNPTNFNLPEEKSFIVNDTLFAGDLTSVVGIWNLTYVSIQDIPLNIIEDYPNITFEVTSAPSGGGTPAGGGGGADAESSTEDRTLTCGQSGLNYSITNIQKNAVFGYSLITDLKNTKPKCRDLLLRNFGNKDATITLNCFDVGANLTRGFCQFVNLSNSVIELPPNALVEIPVKMCIEPLDTKKIEGDEFFFSIQSKDQLNACQFLLPNKMELSSFFGKFVSWRTLDFTTISKSGRVIQYPLVALAFIGGIISFLIFFGIFRLLNLKIISGIMGFLFSLTIFLIIIIFL